MKEMLFDYLKKGAAPARGYDDEVRELRRADMEIDLSSVSLSKKIVTHGNSQSIPINCIKPNPNQPRLDIDPEALSELAASIENYGLMQPITVRCEIPFEYELVAGQRRLEACRMLGMDYIQAIVMNVDETDSAVLALVENIQRENLNYIEEAEAYLGLISDRGMTQEQLASKLGKSQSTVANKLRILKLPIKVRALLCKHGLTERHARALLKLGDEKLQMEAIDKIVKRGLNVARTEALVDRMLKQTKALPPGAETAPSRRAGAFRDIRIFSNTIKKAVELMNRSGVNADCQRSESDEYIEYTIKIPK